MLFQGWLRTGHHAVEIWIFAWRNSVASTLRFLLLPQCTPLFFGFSLLEFQLFTPPFCLCLWRRSCHEMLPVSEMCVF